MLTYLKKSLGNYKITSAKHNEALPLQDSGAVLADDVVQLYYAQQHLREKGCDAGNLICYIIVVIIIIIIVVVVIRLIIIIIITIISLIYIYIMIILLLIMVIMMIMIILIIVIICIIIIKGYIVRGSHWAMGRWANIRIRI